MLTAQDLHDAFMELGARARHEGKVIDLAIYGGSALLLASNFRIATQDGFMPTFGDMPLWNILASCLVIPYISSYPCVTTLMLGRHGRSVAPETASMTEGARFHLDTSHDHPCPLITRCHAATPRGV
jgi:hypothetical protein